MTTLIEGPVDFGGGKIGLSPILADALQRQRRNLAVTLHGPLSHYSVAGPYTRTLGVVVDNLPKSRGAGIVSISPRDLITVLSRLAQTLIALADKMILFQAADVARAMTNMWDKETLSRIISDVTPGTLTLSNSALTGLVYAILEGDGTMMRPGMHHSMASLGLSLLSYEVGTESGGASDDLTDTGRINYLAAAGTWRDLQSNYTQELSSTSAPKGIADDNRSRAILERANLLRQAAVTILGRVIAGYVRVAQGISVWLGSPPIQAAASGRRREELDRGKSYVDGVVTKLTTKYPPIWNLFTPDAFDVDLIGAWKILDNLPEGLIGGIQGPTIPISGGALMADVLFPLSIPPAAIDAWMGMMWSAIESAEDLAESDATVESASIQTLLTPLGNDLDTSEPQSLVSQITPVSGLPYLSPADPVLYLPEEVTTLRRHDLTDWVFHTFTEVRNAIRSNPDLTHVPVIIEGDQGTDIVPVFSGIDDHLKMGSFTDVDPFSSLALILGMAPSQMSDWALSFSAPDSRGLRLLADRFALCGVIGTMSSSASVKGKKGMVPDQIITPTYDYYYHGEDHMNNLGDPISLGHIASGDTLLFLPFKSLPSSALIETFEKQLNLVCRSDAVPSPSYSVRWNQKGAVDGTTLKINGWRRSPSTVSDVVGIPPNGGFKGCQILLGSDGRIEGARITNAILRTGSEAKGWAPSVSALEYFGIHATT